MLGVFGVVLFGRTCLKYEMECIIGDPVRNVAKEIESTPVGWLACELPNDCQNSQVDKY